MHCLQRLTGSLLAASFVCLGASAKPTPTPLAPTILQSVLQVEYDNMNAAEARGHTERYLSYHTADYVESDPTGQHTDIHGRQQDRANAIHNAQWIRHFDATNPDTFHYHDTVKSLHLTRNTVSVTAEERSSIQWPLVEQEKDVWVNQGGRWRMKQRQHGKMNVREAGDGPRQPSP